MLAATVVLALVIGLVGGLWLARLGEGDQIVVGNTAGTLSAVIRVSGELIVVGGGNSSTDLSDLVGRATLPWSRRVDLLVVPGWDSPQAVGALGLIEADQVRSLAILGAVGNHPTWSLLQQSADQHDIPTSWPSGAQQVRLAGDVELDLLAPRQDTPAIPAALVRLRYHGIEITLADVAGSVDRKSLAGWDVLPAQTSLLIASRPLAPNLISSQVVLRPLAQQAAEVEPLAPSYVGELAPGQRLTIGLKGGTIRLPASRLRAQFTTPVS
jgi:hypothetical protein